MKIKTTGLSLAELKVKYKDLFYDQSWYENQKFYNEKPEAVKYDFKFDKETCNKAYQEQLDYIDKGYKPVHVATVIEAIFIHFKETGKRLCEDWYVRTSTLDSDGRRVGVGDFDSGGLGVAGWSDGARGSDLGVSAARQLSLKPRKLGTSDPLNLETLRIEIGGVRYKLIKE